MPPLAQHLMLRLRDDRVLVPSVRSRRVLATTVLRLAREVRLLAFRAADTHLHLAVACGRREAGELARRLEIGLQQRLGLEVGFAPAHLEPIQRQRHLRNTFTYVLRQEQRHGLASDPYHEASNLPDLLALRILGTWTAAHVRALLPRVGRADLLGFFGDPDLEDETVSLDLLPEAAAAAAGLTELSGRSAEVVAARRAAVQAAGLRLTARELAALLGIGERTVKRLRAQPAPEELAEAVELQLRLRRPAAAPSPE